MKFFKKIINYESFKNYIALFVIFFSFNNLIALGSDNKSYSFKSKKNSYEVEDIYKLKSIPFSEYDKLDNQLKTFFGLNSPQSKTNSYPDLSIIDSSDAVREGYLIKLEDMTIDKTNYKIKKEVLFKN